MSTIDKILSLADFFQKFADKKNKKQTEKDHSVKKQTVKKQLDFITSYPKPPTQEKVKIKLNQPKHQEKIKQPQKPPPAVAPKKEIQITPTLDFEALAEQLKAKRDMLDDRVTSGGYYIRGFDMGYEVPLYIFDPDGEVKTTMFKFDKPALLVRFLNKEESGDLRKNKNARVQKVKDLLGSSASNYIIESKELSEVDLGLENRAYDLIVAITAKE